MDWAHKALFLKYKKFSIAVILLISALVVGIARADEPEDAVSEQDDRSEEIRKAVERAQNIQKPERVDATRVPGKPAQGNVPEGKKSEETAQPPEPVRQAPEGNKATELSVEEERLEYASLENITWESAEKKIILRAAISGEATPEIEVIRDRNGMMLRVIPKGLATRMPRELLGLPAGVQSLSILEDPTIAKVWRLEAPYYAAAEMQILFDLPVQYSLRQEPGSIEITFILPKKVEQKKPVAPGPSLEGMENMQQEALNSPETTLGASYQSERQLENNLLFGVQRPPSLTDLYQREAAKAEFQKVGELPQDVRPLLESVHPPFGTEEYFKKYVHGNIRQTVNFASNYNRGITTAFQEGLQDRGAPERGKNIGNIIGTPAATILFYRPGVVNVSTGYSGSRDFPMAHDNFVYGLERQKFNVRLGHYPKKRYAFDAQSNLNLFGGTLRQKINGKWIHAPLQSREGYRFDNSAGLNYRLSKRLLWGTNIANSETRSETDTAGGRSRNLFGDVNTYLKYRMTSRLDLLLGTSFLHVFKDTSGTDNTSLAGPSTIMTTKGKNLDSVYLTADYRYSKKFSLTGTFQGSLIDWDIGKVGGAVKATYKRSPHDDLSFQYGSSVIQNTTGLIIPSITRISERGSVLLQRYVTMGLKYNRRFDQGRTRGSLEVLYSEIDPLSGVFYGRSTTTTINYDIRFIASIRRALWKNRAWLGLLYSYEYAPSTLRNSVSGAHDKISNTSQNIILTMDYVF